MKIAFGIVMGWIASGCWGAELASDESSPAEPEVLAATQHQVLDKQADGAHAACRSFLLRQRECSAQLIPALVDARVERDEPPGVAARARAVGRAALVAEALEEWDVDSRDQAIDGLCSKIAQTIAPARVPQLESAVSSCLEQAGCDAFAACAVPVSLERWKG